MSKDDLTLHQKLDNLTEHIIEIKEKAGKTEQHLKGINGFVADQKKANSEMFKKINSNTNDISQAKGAVKILSVISTLLAIAGATKVLGLW